MAMQQNRTRKREKKGLRGKKNSFRARNSVNPKKRYAGRRKPSNDNAEKEDETQHAIQCYKPITLQSYFGELGASDPISPTRCIEMNSHRATRCRMQHHAGCLQICCRLSDLHATSPCTNCTLN